MSQSCHNFAVLVSSTVQNADMPALFGPKSAPDLQQIGNNKILQFYRINANHPEQDGGLEHRAWACRIGKAGFALREGVETPLGRQILCISHKCTGH